MFLDVTRIFDIGPCSNFDFGFLSKSLILDYHNLCNWVGSDFALRSVRFWMSEPARASFLDLIDIRFWITTIKHGMKKQGEEEREGERDQ